MAAYKEHGSASIFIHIIILLAVHSILVHLELFHSFSIVKVYHNLFRQSTTDEYLDSDYSLAIANNAVLNSLHIFHFPYVQLYPEKFQVELQ